MKRSNQLIIESVIVVGLILGVALGGTISTLSIPNPWADIQNPANFLPQYDLGKFALFYNSTLSQLGNSQFSSVSDSLNQSSFLNYPKGLAPSVASANSEIASLNVSIPLAISGFNTTAQLIQTGQITNASQAIDGACHDIRSANSTLSQFEGGTTKSFISFGVPVSLYSPSEGLVQSLIDSLLGQCRQLSSQVTALIKSSVNFTISSPQSAIVTGGFVLIQGRLLFNNSGVGNAAVSLYMNDSKFASTSTTGDGTFSINSSTPFVYSSEVAISAFASENQQIGFPGAVSNTLYLQVIFNETQINLADPPGVLPTFNFTVHGELDAKGGTPLPNAPIKITSFGTDYFVETNASGVFSDVLTVPANATDGIHYIYAAFAPQGVFGPSVNFTSIEVIHEPITVVLNSIPQSYSGFGMKIVGTVFSNGTGLSQANITISTPWGDLPSQTDQNGRFEVNTNVPLLEFGPVKTVSALAMPQQQYISSGSSSISFSILNPLEIVLPLLAVGVITYELKSLDLFPHRRSRNKEREGEEDDSRDAPDRKAEQISLEETIQKVLPESSLAGERRVGKDGSPRKQEHKKQILQLYKSALALASRRFDITFKESRTIREISTDVSRAAGESSEGTGEFRAISRIVEDFFYSEYFSPARIEDGTDALERLEVLWKEVGE